METRRQPRPGRRRGQSASRNTAQSRVARVQHETLVFWWVFQIGILLGMTLVLLSSTARAEVRDPHGAKDYVSFEFVGDAFTVGVVPQFGPQKTQEIWQPILHELEALTGQPFELSVSKDISAFERALMGGDYDFVYVNPLQFLKAHAALGYRPILRDTSRSLSGIIVERADAPRHALTALDGATMAFPSPLALGATLLPRLELQQRYGVSVQPRYVKSHPSVYLNVLAGTVRAGGGVQATFDQQPEAVREQLRIIYRTQRLPAHPLAVYPDVPTDIVEQVREAFQSLTRTKEGKALLQAIPMGWPGRATVQDYARLRNMGFEDAQRQLANTEGGQ